MRKRIGNPFDEAHQKPMRCFDWIAPAATMAPAIPVLIEALIPGLKVYHRGDGEQNGYVSTSRLPNGLLYVSVSLYDSECRNPNCPAGHVGVSILVAPSLTASQEAMLSTSTGEDAQYRSFPRGERGEPADVVLGSLGFGPNDPPRRST